jgi:hypothetical protein
VLLPVWLAVIEQAPPETIVTVAAVTVQTDGVAETKLTGRLELAVAITGNGKIP